MKFMDDIIVEMNQECTHKKISSFSIIDYHIYINNIQTVLSKYYESYIKLNGYKRKTFLSHKTM